MADHFIQCPHCTYLIPITGKGSKTVVKMEKPKTPRVRSETPKPTLHDILGDHFDSYWKVANLFGASKNFKPSETAGLYMDALTAGATDEGIYSIAARLARLTSEQKYLPQFAKWLEGQSYLPANLPPPGEVSESSRLLSRRRAE